NGVRMAGRTAGGERRELAERVPEQRPRGRTAEGRPAREPGAHERGLGPPRAVGGAGERVLAGGLGGRLGEVGPQPPRLGSHPRREDALAGEEEGGHGASRAAPPDAAGGSVAVTPRPSGSLPPTG